MIVKWINKEQVSLREKVNTILRGASSERVAVLLLFDSHVGIA